MAIAYRRIIDQLDDTELQSGDYIMVDSETEGTRKYDLGAGMSGKVDKETGKGLSTEDYTTAEKTKLSEVEAQANKTIIDATLANTGQAADAKKVGDELSAVKEDLEQIEPGLSEEAKAALLACFEHVAWTDDHGQDYYDDLYEALYTNTAHITAVYSPGTFKPDSGDALSVLNNYLTVTYYEDESATGVVVDNYTLSGNLDSATSTITVTYNGLRDTFDVSVEVWDYVWKTSSGVVPPNMTYISYNFTDQSGILHVYGPDLNMNYVGSCELEVECAFPSSDWQSHPQINVNYALNGTTRNTIRVCGGRGDDKIYVNTSGDWVTTGFSQTVYRVYNIKTSGSSGRITIDGSSTYTGSGNTSTGTHVCTGIFSATNASSKAQNNMYIKSIKFRAIA